jgi:hypothetical protein
MQRRSSILVGLVAAAVNGCGGGAGGAGSEMSGTGTSYAFVPPPLGLFRVLTETIVDNFNTTITIGESDTTTAVDSNGGYTALVQSTTGDTDIINGTNYALPTEIQSYDDSGRELAYTFTGPTGDAVNCTYSPHANGPEFPVQVGQTWQIAYTFSCDTGATRRPCTP